MFSFADAILQENYPVVQQYLQAGAPINELDEYGFTPLIEAAIANNTKMAELLLMVGADPKIPDAVGGTALHWAVENNNQALAKLLLERGANPNAYTLAGQPILVMPLLRHQQAMKKLLFHYGANLIFAQDYINTKLLGHMFELVGTANILDPTNHLVEVDFEGFIFEFSLAVIAESLVQFKNHFAARELRRYGPLLDMASHTIARAAHLIKYQQYNIDLNKYQGAINALLAEEPLIIPLGYEGHAITFIKAGNILVKCDRREDSRLYDNIYFYQIQRPEIFTHEFIKDLIYERQSGEFVNEELPRILALQPITELKIAAQISGNCSWANVEACIPALLFLNFSKASDFSENMLRYKNTALKIFQQWREWNKDRTLNFCIQGFEHANPIRKMSKAEILAAILFQSCQGDQAVDNTRVEAILAVLTLPQYEYILQNYIKSYSYEDAGEEGRHFLRLLQAHGYTIKRF